VPRQIPYLLPSVPLSGESVLPIIGGIDAKVLKHSKGL